MSQIVKMCNSSFFSPVSRSKGVDLSDDLVIVTEFIDFVEQGPSGEASDFVIYKKPVEVERYHHNKVIAERSKGATLKEIVARCDASGDYSTLTQRKVIFGDGFVTPRTLGDALDKAEEGAAYLDKLGSEEVDRLISLSKLSKEDLKAYIDSQVKEAMKTESTSINEVNSQGGEK